MLYGLVLFICTKDGQNNRIRQWEDAQVNRGVFEGELLLGDQVVFGDWKVVTQVNGNVSKGIRFEKLLKVNTKEFSFRRNRRNSLWLNM